MKKQFTIIIALLLFSFGAFSQTQKAFIEAAEEAYISKNYYSSLVYYQEAVAFEESNIDLRYNLAESSRKFMSYSLAEQNYQFVKENDSENSYPLATYYLAEMMQKQGKYQEAIEMYDLYLSENSGDDEYFTMKADKERAASEWAMTEIEEPDESINVGNAGDKINTVYSDVAPSINEDELYFTSMRFEDKNDKKSRISKVMKSKLPEDFNGDFGSANVIEGDLNSDIAITANTAFNKDRSKLFYTVCERLNDSEIRCDLYCRMIDENGKMGAVKKLPDFVNAEGFTSTQPTVGYDKDRDKEILYFSSDRPGGKGKLDLWYSIIDNKDNFTKPMNLESVNTKEDELTPFFHIPSSTLYFSSDGYRSFGGYDVYSTRYDGSYSEPLHLNNPLNSSYHDIYFVLSDDEETGYFSTNREGAQFIDNIQQACCFDIYKVKFDELDLNLDALTFDKISLGDLVGATVKLYNEDTGELVGEITNDEGNSHLFKLDRCTNYLIIGEKLGYKSDTLQYSTCGLKKSQDITKKLFLEPEFLELDVFTFDEQTKLELAGSTIVLKNLTDAGIEDVVVTNATANDFNFTLVRGHNYKLLASNPGYYPASIDIMTSGVGGTKITKNIYLKQDPVGMLDNMLPLTLYFDNDHPNPRTVAKTTNKTYTTTYERYLKRKPSFMRRSQSPETMEMFFENDVVGGYNKLTLFLSQLVPTLEKGISFEITVKGFASPLSRTDYNLILGQRRISSIMNEIRRYNDGALIPYLESGQLVVTDISYGEELAPKDISDSSSDTPASIYSVQASKERRVEIIEVTRQQK